MHNAQASNIFPSLKIQTHEGCPSLAVFALRRACEDSDVETARVVNDGFRPASHRYRMVGYRARALWPANCCINQADCSAPQTSGRLQGRTPALSRIDCILPAPFMFSCNTLRSSGSKLSTCPAHNHQQRLKKISQWQNSAKFPPSRAASEARKGLRFQSTGYCPQAVEPELAREAGRGSTDCIAGKE